MIGDAEPTRDGHGNPSCRSRCAEALVYAPVEWEVFIARYYASDYTDHIHNLLNSYVIVPRTNEMVEFAQIASAHWNVNVYIFLIKIALD